MPKIVWNRTGERRYETGLDRGVLYLQDGSGVPWNGLIAVEDDNGDIETNAYYYDGVKYLDTRYPGDFSATLRAFTFPDEFLQFDGYTELNNGVLLGHQPVYERFGLSYRTMIGNDVDGDSHGYKIHILYNLVAVPSNTSHNTMSSEKSPTDFTWKISGVPESVPGHRPTVHIILDTTRLDPHLVSDVENLLYGQDPDVVIPPDDVVDGGTPGDVGTGSLDDGLYNSPDLTVVDGGRPSQAAPPVVNEGSSPSAKLPPLADLVQLLNTWVLIDIVDNGDGTWTATGPDDAIIMLEPTKYQINGAQVKFIDEDTYEISSTSSF